MLSKELKTNIGARYWKRTNGNFEIEVLILITKCLKIKIIHIPTKCDFEQYGFYQFEGHVAFFHSSENTKLGYKIYWDPKLRMHFWVHFLDHSMGRLPLFERKLTLWSVVPLAMIWYIRLIYFRQMIYFVHLFHAPRALEALTLPCWPCVGREDHEERLDTLLSGKRFLCWYHLNYRIASFL